jgi:hypothetical protein
MPEYIPSTTRYQGLKSIKCKHMGFAHLRDLLIDSNGVYAADLPGKHLRSAAGGLLRNPYFLLDRNFSELVYRNVLV